MVLNLSETEIPYYRSRAMIYTVHVTLIDGLFVEVIASNAVE
jgi:hypothetical protein